MTPSSVRLSSGRQRIVVDARLPAGGRDQIFYRKIDDPPLYFGLWAEAARTTSW